MPAPCPGLHSLSLHIIEVRDLKSRVSDTSTLNPYVEVRLFPFDIKQSTRLRTSTFNARFDELLTFQLNVQDVRDLSIGRISVGVYHFGKLGTVLIGGFVFGMEDVYARQGHELFQEWVALADSNEGDGERVKGYLKVSIALVGPNDKPVTHSIEEMESEQENVERDKNGWEIIKNCSYSKAMKLKTWGIKAYLFRAENLPASDVSSLYRKNVCDPYVTMQFGDSVIVPSTAKSRVVPQTQNPVWEPGTYIYLRAALPDLSNSAQLPQSSQFIELSVCDEHLGKEKDARLATCYIPFKSLMQDRLNILLADRCLSAFFHPKSSEKKKAILMEKFKLNELKKSENDFSTDITLEVGMELRGKEKRDLVKITKLDAENRLIYCNFVVSDTESVLADSLQISSRSNAQPPSSLLSPSAVGLEFVISRKNYKDWWIIPPLKYARPFWINLYGAPEKDQSNANFAKLMNEGRKEGSCYRGRLCMSIHLFESESFDLANQKSALVEGVPNSQYFELKRVTELVPGLSSMPCESKYRLVLKPMEGSMLYCASSLIDRYFVNEEVIVVVQCGSYTWQSKPAMIKQGIAEWNDSFLDTQMIFPVDVLQIPDLFIYLERASGSRKGKRISFLRFNMCQFFVGLQSMQVTKKMPMWYALIEDPVLNLIPFGEFPGQLLISAAFGLADDKSWGTIARDIVSIASVKKCSYFLWAHIFQGQNLAASKLANSCDPYLFVSCNNRDAITLVKKATVNPIWNQSLGFKIDLYPNPNNLERGSPIFVSIIDKSNKSERVIGNFWFSPQKAFDNGLDYTQAGLFPVENYSLKSIDRSFNTSVFSACFQLFEISDNVSNPNPDPILMNAITFDGFSKLNPVLVPPEFHPQNFTVVIELLGLRDMSLAGFSALLLAMKEPKIYFEVGGIRTLFALPPSFISNGNYNFGESQLPVITIETKLLYSSWNSPSINIEVRNGIFEALVGRGNIFLSADLIVGENLDEVNDVSSIATGTTQNSFLSSSVFNPNLDQDLGEMLDDLEDEDNVAPGEVVSEANVKQPLIKRAIALEDTLALNTNTGNFFGSRDAHQKFETDIFGGLSQSASSSRVAASIPQPVGHSFVPLRIRVGGAEKSEAAPALPPLQSAAKPFVPLRARNANLSAEEHQQELPNEKWIDEVKNDHFHIELPLLKIEKENGLAKPEIKPHKVVSFQDIIKNNRNLVSDENNILDHKLLSDESRDIDRALKLVAASNFREDLVDDDDNEIDTRWFMRGRTQVDSEQENAQIWVLDQLPLQNRFPTDWSEKLLILTELVYQNWFDNFRSISLNSLHSKLDPQISALLLHAKAEVIANVPKEADRETTFFYNGPFVCALKSVSCLNPSKEFEDLMSKKDSESKVFLEKAVEIRFLVEVPILADNNGCCFITQRCTLCGMEKTSHCGCTSSFLFSHRKYLKKDFTLTIVFPPKSAKSKAPILHAFCSHPLCWLQKKVNMCRGISVKHPFSFPVNFSELGLRFASKKILVSPFQNCPLFNGKGKSASSVGLVKCRIRVLKGWQRYDTLKRKEALSTSILKRETFRVRVYVLRGINLSLLQSARSKKPSSYLIVKLGRTSFNTANVSELPQYSDRIGHKEAVWGKIENSSNPDFARYGCFEFEATIPGESRLSISVRNLSLFGIDSEIGQTVIDLEERVLSSNFWSQYPPLIERRSLFQTDSNQLLSRGKLEMWIEMLPASYELPYPVLDIIPPPPSNWELRVIIYGCENIPNYDSLTEANDLFIRCQIEGGTWKETDIHFRARDGKGSFNWRMKFPLQLPLLEGLNDRFKLQVWDKDLIESDDAIAEAYLDLKPAFRKALKTHKRVVLHNDWKVKEPHNMDWFNLTRPNAAQSQGKILFSLELLPEKMAESLQNGSGQTAPNKYPFLPPPEGRPEWNWMRPDLILLNLLGPTLFAKLQRCISWFFYFHTQIFACH